MALRSTPLPRDPDKLIEIVLNRESEIETLTATIATLRTLIFGPRSERSPGLIAQQIPLDLGDLISDIAPPANDDLEEDKNKKARSAPPKNVSAILATCPYIYHASTSQLNLRLRPARVALAICIALARM